MSLAIGQGGPVRGGTGSSIYLEERKFINALITVRRAGGVRQPIEFAGGRRRRHAVV